MLKKEKKKLVLGELISTAYSFYFLFQMFYSVDLLRIRGSKKGRLPKCWIAATIKEFVGREKTKIDKQEIIKFDIEAAW